MTDYYEILEEYTNNPLRITSQKPSVNDLKEFLKELEIRYDNLRNSYQRDMLPILSDMAQMEITMSEVFEYLDTIINVHQIDFESDSVSMILGKLMYMFREPDYTSQFHLSDIAELDFHRFYCQSWFEVAELAKCQIYFDDFHINLYEYFDDEMNVKDKNSLTTIYNENRYNEIERLAA